MQWAIAGCLYHPVGSWVSCDVKCTSAVLVTVIRNNCCPHVLLLEPKDNKKCPVRESGGVGYVVRGNE